MKLSNSASLIQIIVFALVPLIGVFFFGWDWRVVIILYWLETLTVGLVTFILTQKTALPEGAYKPAELRSVKRRPLKKARLLGFDFFTYSWVVLLYGIVVLMIGGFNPKDGFHGGIIGLIVAALPGWLIVSVVPVVSAIFRKAPTHLEVISIVLRTISRVFIIHASFVLGIFAIGFFGIQPIVGALILISLRFTSDVMMGVASRVARSAPVIQ